MPVNTATIVANFGEAKQKTIDNIQVETRNVPTGMSANAKTDEDRKVSIQVIGVESVIDNISSDNIKAFIDLAGYTTGDHTVKVQVEGEDPKAQYIVTSSINISLTTNK